MQHSLGLVVKLVANPVRLIKTLAPVVCLIQPQRQRTCPVCGLVLSILENNALEERISVFDGIYLHMNLVHLPLCLIRAHTSFTVVVHEVAL